MGISLSAEMRLDVRRTSRLMSLDSATLLTKGRQENSYHYPRQIVLIERCVRLHSLYFTMQYRARSSPAAERLVLAPSAWQSVSVPLRLRLDMPGQEVSPHFGQQALHFLPQMAQPLSRDPRVLR